MPSGHAAQPHSCTPANHACMIGRMDTNQYFKVIHPETYMTPQGRGPWTPGVWQEVNGPLEPCANGLHVVTATQAVSWVRAGYGLAHVEVDPASEIIDNRDKTVVRRARATEFTLLNDDRLGMFAADCAAHVLHIFEKERPSDMRPRDAIKSRRNRAASDAAMAAAWAAAMAAVGDAAWDAAWAAAWAAVGAAECEWQGERLLYWATEPDPKVWPLPRKQAVR